MAKEVDWDSIEGKGLSQNTPEPTIRTLLAMQSDLLEKLHQAIVDLAINLEPIMREDPRTQDELSSETKPGARSQFMEDIERHNWQIEKAIGDVNTMMRLSAI